MFLYCTGDSIGEPTGGGKVTQEESDALAALGPVKVFDRKRLEGGNDPWGWDEVMSRKSFEEMGSPKLAHFYSGCFSKTVAKLKANGCKVIYTVAAHDRKVSQEEHAKLGIPFNYPHLVEPFAWSKYVEGYRLADAIICPGSVPAKTVREYGGDFAGKRIEVIPHGVDVPIEQPKRFPKRFVVGYMGSLGPDKGVIYLLQAWKQLNFKDVTLVLAGRDSISPFAHGLIERFGGGTICLMGWVDKVADFYDSISLFVCPAATEGFNLETLEAMAHGRPVVCSEGAGAVDLLPEWYRFQARNVEELTAKIEQVKIRNMANEVNGGYPYWKGIALDNSWTKVKERYQAIWKGMLA